MLLAGRCGCHHRREPLVSDLLARQGFLSLELALGSLHCPQHLRKVLVDRLCDPYRPMQIECIFVSAGSQ